MRSLARRLLHAHLEWVAEVEAAFASMPKRTQQIRVR